MLKANFNQVASQLPSVLSANPAAWMNKAFRLPERSQSKIDQYRERAEM
ncbi:hypothetical protein [Donghicola sp.]|nr:hypothetical protein [Donghicola sp.]MCT4579750.1 hypothetical protein [Donghicola sp.]